MLGYGKYGKLIVKLCIMYLITLHVLSCDYISWGAEDSTYISVLMMEVVTVECCELSLHTLLVVNVL